MQYDLQLQKRNPSPVKEHFRANPKYSHTRGLLAAHVGSHGRDSGGIGGSSVGSPVALLYFPCWFGRFLGLFGSGAGAGLETFRWGGASGSAGRPRRGAPGAEVPPAWKSASRENSQPPPPRAPVQTRRPPGQGGGARASGRPGATDGTLTPAPRCSRGQGSPRNRRAGLPPLWLLPVARAAGV